MTEPADQIKPLYYVERRCNMRGENGCHPCGWGFVINNIFWCSFHASVIWLESRQVDQLKQDAQRISELIAQPGIDAEILKTWLMIKRFLDEELFEIPVTMRKIPRATLPEGSDYVS